MRALLVTVAASFVLAGCSRKDSQAVDAAPPAKKYTLQISKPWSAPVEITRGGAPVVTCEARNFDCTASAELVRMAEGYDASGFAARVLTPHGWRALTVKLAPDTGAPDAVALRYAEELATLSLFVDARGVDAVDLTVGELPIAVDPNGKSEPRIPFPAGAAAVSVKSRGKELGQVQGLDAGRGIAGALIDVAGGHCYHRREVFYSSAPSTARKPDLLRGGHVYVVGTYVDSRFATIHFLTEAPSTMSTNGSTVTHEEILDAPCDPPKK